LNPLAALKAAVDQHDGIDQPVHDDGIELLHHAGDHLVGAATLQLGYPIEACILVHPGHRRRGIGRRLLDRCRAECRARGQGLLLTVEERSASGREFARAVGATLQTCEYRMELMEPPPEPTWVPGLALREIGVADAATFGRVRTAAFGDPFEPETVVRTVAAIRAGRHRHLLAELDGEPVATIRTSLTEPCYVTGFGVLPSHQRRGLGRQILARVVRDLAAEGRDPIRLEVATDNPRALDLYRRSGFREINAYGYYEVATSWA
jgi:ribosomal protein S18 acetylase RimI-like enzyme